MEGKHGETRREEKEEQLHLAGSIPFPTLALLGARRKPPSWKEFPHQERKSGVKPKPDLCVALGRLGKLASHPDGPSGDLYRQLATREKSRGDRWAAAAGRSDSAKQ